MEPKQQTAESFQEILHKSLLNMISGVSAGLVVYYFSTMTNNLISATIYIAITSIVLTLLISWFIWHNRDYTLCKRTEIIESEKFKNLIKEMFRGYPKYYYYGMIENAFDKETTADLIEEKFFIKKGITDKNGKKVDGYKLSISVLPFVSAWKTEDLTRSIKSLTILVMILTIISIIIALVK